MILIGQYDSPFVRRVAVTLRLYKLNYEHRPWSAIGDADKIAEINPLMRVPTLITSDGEAITDSGTIIQLLDHLAGFGAFLSRNWPQQGDVLRLAGFAAGVADKGVALLYEGAFHTQALPVWHERLHRQVADTLAMLDRERVLRKTPWLFGERLSHADIMIGTMFCFLREALPGAFDLDGYKALRKHSKACDALPEFKQAYQSYKLGMPADA
ncbi:MAG TPA: glutathione S-transferase family protein [Sphingomonas sp.]|uniref:glutathione S-transferase family protein n=1 Tax=Sphingomonas sp. TaxID=28214 RepID=UPI002C5A1624|nr:glutathione S-transferase family protein [Sphingomonas sp.]HMI20748.1 glutathione S-transferase family protein [Sphingomonas sp.]